MTKNKTQLLKVAIYLSCVSLEQLYQVQLNFLFKIITLLLF